VLGASSNGGCQDVPVIRVWQIQSLNETFSTVHAALGERNAHRRDLRFNACLKVGLAFQQVGFPFVDYFG
jgi:hypothetical protein